MGFTIRRSGRLFQNIGNASDVRTSIGAPGTGISLQQSSNGDGRFILGTAVLVIISVLVLLLT